MNTKTLYIVKHIALVTLFAMGLVLVPAFNSSGTVLAQKNMDREIAAKEALAKEAAAKGTTAATSQKNMERERATPDMLSRALDFRSATDLTVYAENGVTDKGSSSIRGNVLSATGGNAQDAKTQESRRDLSNAFSAINQLPCTNVSDSNLSGKTFAPGVYCLSSAELAGQMVLDGGNSTGSIFVFRIAGSLNTKSGSSVSLINNAQSSNVFFAADDSASIGEGTNFRGNVLARNTVKADGGAVIEGRVMSVKGDVQLNDSVLAPAAPGFIEICKALDTTPVIGATQLNETFDGVTAPALPAGFTSTSLSGTTNLFTTSTTTPFTAPNSAFAADVDSISSNALNTPTIFDVFTNSQLRFQINTNLEVPNFDGVVLEVSVNGGAFQDILATGSTFATGGYNGVINNATGNPLGGRQGFVGNSGGYVNSIVNLSPALTGQNLQFRFVLGTDFNNLVGTPTGVNIDNVVVGAPTANTGLENRIFQFRIGALITEVPAGQCSGPISIEAGPIVIEELLTGRTTTGGTFNGNFQLTDVRQLTNLGQPNTTALTSANLPLRTANVNVVAGDISSQTRLQFTNRFAIIGVVEICKEGIDSGVTGFFNFTIDGLRNTAAPGTTGPLVGGQLTTPAPLVNFSVPVGQCSGPIAVTALSDVNSGPPRMGQATINELPRTGFLFTSATTALGTAGTPTNRLINFNVFGNGGGNATVLVVAGSDGGDGTNTGIPSATLPGAATSVQTTVFFNNRTAPGQLKVCKIAGPGIAQLTPFNFAVGGVVPFAPVAVDTPVAVTNGSVLGTSGTVLTSGLATTQNPTLGTLRVAPAPAAVPQGGTFQQSIVTVLAGPASNPGGFCQIVPSTFVVDTAAYVAELAPTTTTIVDANGASTGVTGQVRISRMASSTGILSVINNNVLTTAQTNLLGSFPIANPISGTGAVQPGVQFFPLNGSNQNTGTATGMIVPIRRGVTEVEFVNVAFSPVPLKICKVAGTGVIANNNNPVTFTVTQDTAGGLLAPFSSTVSVLPGPAAVNPGDQNGNCDFARGPFTNPLTNALGSFNFNSTVTVTETGGITGTVVAPNGITSPTGGVIADIANRSALISNMVNGVNEVQFVNQAATGGTTPPTKTVKKRTRFF